MNVLILGGNGFIGSHLADLFLQKGSYIRILDKSLDRFRKQNPKIDYRIIPIENKIEVAEALVGIDLVYHCLSTTVPSTSILDPIYDINTNLVCTINLLDLMCAAGTKRIVYISSGGAIYGNPIFNPVSEDHSLKPISSYGIVKVAVENYLLMYQYLYGLQPTIIRPSNPYGPYQGHQSIQGVISTFLSNIKDNKDLAIWGSGDNIRDYIHINDLIDLCYIAGTSNEIGIFNVGSGIGTSINELVELILSITKAKVQIKYLKKRDFDVEAIVLDIKKANKVFNWSPQISLREGIKDYWEWLIK